MKRFLKKNYPYTYELQKALRKFYKGVKGDKYYVIEDALENYRYLRYVVLDDTVAAWAVWWGCALDKRGYKTADDFIHWHLTKRA